MSKSIIPLPPLQQKIMKEFYSIPKTKVIFNKAKRNLLWKQAVQRDKTLNFNELKLLCPALNHQIIKSYETGKNIQPAVFSECVYAQTFANMLQLFKFINCSDYPNFIPSNVSSLLKSYNLMPRYAYSNNDKSRMLIQAGGCNGIDSALITVINLDIYTIEFKEPGAKTSEPDLPKYGEDGKIKITKIFLDQYPQFKEMLNEKRDLNFFECMGSNINDFSAESINIAVSNNYSKKYADVICTEDIEGYLVMMPANQVKLWAHLEGEIRPAGRNHYNVWTPISLKKFLSNKGAVINGDIITINKANLLPRKERGGDGKVSGYKINPLFFVRIKDCKILLKNSMEYISFHMSKVRQLNPTIAGKMFFKTLKYDEVQSHYKQQF